MTRRNGALLIVVTALAAALALQLIPPPQQAEAQPSIPFFSYAAKFVCGFNNSNIGWTSPPFTSQRGEATVKIGNYATEINIFNPQLNGFDIKKKVLIVYQSNTATAYPAIGREPNTVKESGAEGIFLDMCHATMDDCNKIYEMANIPVVNPPIMAIGFLVIQSPQELDVTAVYTAELCSDWRVGGGPATMCNNVNPPNANYGVSLSIDVEQVEGKKIG